MSRQPVLPGGTIGLLGSGQLGRMAAMAARRMGYRVHVYSPDGDSPTGQVADVEVVGEYDDGDALARFAAGVDVVTLEFENIPMAAAERVERVKPLRPRPEVLHTTQHRLREKTWLRAWGFPVTEFVAVTDELPAEFGYPAILKTAGFGYDGKGQIRVEGAEQLEAAWTALERQPCVLERVVDFEREISVVAVRGVDGSFVDYGVMENAHARHILDLTLAPCVMPLKVEKQAVEITRGIFEELDIVGTACVEFFLRGDGEVVVNEIAPRPHNSGHLTVDACVTSQFENQVRAVCGLPLGDTSYYGAAAMANLLGDLWAPVAPNWQALLRFPEVKLHLYGKQEARVGRKMGHVTALGKTGAQAAGIVRAARAALAHLG